MCLWHTGVVFRSTVTPTCPCLAALSQSSMGIGQPAFFNFLHPLTKLKAIKTFYFFNYTIITILVFLHNAFNSLRKCFPGCSHAPGLEAVIVCIQTKSFTYNRTSFEVMPTHTSTNRWLFTSWKFPWMRVELGTGCMYSHCIMSKKMGMVARRSSAHHQTVWICKGV